MLLYRHWRKASKLIGSHVRILSNLILSALLIVPTLLGAKTMEEVFEQLPVYNDEEINAILKSFDYQQGEIVIPGANAILNVPEGYYFLGPKDAQTVLEDIWENPEAESMGMIFPAIYTPFDFDSWGVELSWEPIGYVSDEDAADIDYDDLLVTMKSDIREESRWRVENGYDSLELIGWATPPSYDLAERKLHWAMELEFGEIDVNTLNYNLRALGRRGVLQLNFIASIDQLSEVEAALPDVAAMASFQDGSRYIDFDASLDTVAAVGIGGLIAGKVLAKTGFLLVLLLFLKKFVIILILPVLWIFRKITGGRNV